MANRVVLHTGPGVFEVLAHVCRNPQEALKQFVENAADAIDEAHAEDSYVHIRLHYEPADGDKRALKRIAIEDNGTGIAPEKMKSVLQRIGDSEKINLALRGEQGIGLLAFALIAQELHLASSPAEGQPSRCLVLKRPWLKKGYAEIVEHCPAHEHTRRGTTAHLEGILPEIASQLAKEKVRVYLGQQFASDLRASLYTMAISDGGPDAIGEQVHSQRFRGVKVMSASLSLGKGASTYVELYVLPWEMADASISLFGRRGAHICSLTDLADFKVLPWLDQRLEGYLRCDRLKRTADKTAVVQDGVYRSFVSELRQLEPKIQELISDVSAESQERRFNIILGRAGKLIDKFLRYRERGILASLPLPSPSLPGNGNGESTPAPVGAATKPLPPSMNAPPVARATRAPYIRLSPPPRERSEYRSWYDAGEGVICINREHAEFLLSQREDRRCLRYLFSIWAKESLLKEFGADAERVADELVGTLAEAEPLLW